MGTQLLKIILTNANLHFYIHVLHAKLTARHIPTIFFSKGFGHIDGIYDVKVGDGAPRVQQLKKKTKKQLTKMS